VSTVSPLLGRKFSPGRLKRHREACARRKAEGFYETPSYKRFDPRTKVLTLVCATPSCDKQFTFTRSPRFLGDTPRYCSHICQLRHNHILRTKVPQDYETLYDLYWTKNMSTVEIGEMFGSDNSTVREAMVRAGVPRRKSGPRRKAANLC
jgi:hypothetical protein